MKTTLAGRRTSALPSSRGCCSARAHGRHVEIQGERPESTGIRDGKIEALMSLHIPSPAWREGNPDSARAGSR